MSETTVMIVDDETQILQTLGLYLRARGFDVVAAESAKRALELARDAAGRGEAIDLLLTDIRMPEMDGSRLVKEFRAEGFDCPVVVMSGYGEPDNYRELAGLDCRYFIRKPFMPSQVEDVIVRIIAGPEDASLSEFEIGTEK